MQESNPKFKIEVTDEGLKISVDLSTVTNNEGVLYLMDFLSDNDMEWYSSAEDGWDYILDPNRGKVYVASDHFYYPIQELFQTGECLCVLSAMSYNEFREEYPWSN